MLKLLDNSAALKFHQTPMKCAEIFFQTAENFTIICTYCDIKSFDYNDFLWHFKNVHLHLPNKKQNHKTNNNLKEIKDESLEEENILNLPNILDDENAQKDEVIDVKTETQNLSSSNTEITILNDSTSNDNDISNDNDEIDNHQTDIITVSNLDAMICDNDSAFDNCIDIVDDDDSEDDFQDDDDEEYSLPLKVLPSTVAQTKKTINKECKCSHCGKSYKTEKALEKHVKSVHNTGETYTCDSCNQVFTLKRALELHQQRSHQIFPCQQCDRVYKKKDSLRTHMFNHTSERNFVCDYENCGKAFYNGKVLNTHKRNVHLTERNYVCEICGYRSKKAGALVIHKRSHTGEKPFKCEICGKGFASKPLLIEHKPKHSDARPFKCDVCGATFSRSKALYHHKPLHLDVKKFVCKLCGRAFAQAAGLSGHLRQHKAEMLNGVDLLSINNTLNT